MLLSGAAVPVKTAISQGGDAVFGSPGGPLPEFPNEIPPFFLTEVCDGDPAGIGVDV